MQIICENCGAVLNEEMKFCYKCGTKVPLMAAAPKRVDSTISENYGEVLGSERYWRFNYSVREYDATSMEMNPIYLLSNINHEAYFNNRYYYFYKYDKRPDEGINGTYICSSREDGTDVKAIARLKSNEGWYKAQIFVNHQGIYLIGIEKIIVVSFEGEELLSLKIENMVNYYICDARILVVVTDSSKKNYEAKWLDINEKVWHRIASIKWKKAPQDSKYQEGKGGEIKYIMANSKRAIMWLYFYDYYLSEDGEKERAWEFGGWYNYDFETKKLKCIDKTRYYPHYLETKPEVIEKYLKRPWDERKGTHLAQIAAFDMEKDLMWVKKDSSNGYEIWEPRRIGHVEKTQRDNRYPDWRVRSEYFTQKGYFDGTHLYEANCYALYHYDKDGNKSEDLKANSPYPADSFRVCGNKLFFINSFSGIDQQFSMITEPSASLRMNWMEYQGFYDSEMIQNEERHKEAIIRFIYEKAGVASSQKESYHDSASPQTMSQPAQPTGGSGKGLRLKSQLNQSTQSSAGSGKGLRIRNDSGSQSTQPEKTVTSKLEYWQEFVDYAFEGTYDQKFKSDFPRAEPADRNWYALRLGSAKAHIELSVNTQKETIRTAILLKDENLLYQLEPHLKEGADIIVDRKSQTKSISLIHKGGLNNGRKEQFDWFIDVARDMKRFVKKYTNI